MSDCESVSDLTPLAQLNKLKFVHFRNTPVHDMSPLKNLKSLQILSASKTKVDANQIQALQESTQFPDPALTATQPA